MKIFILDRRSLYRREDERKPPKSFSHVRRKPIDAPVQRIKHIKLGQVKRAQGRLMKHGWR